MFRRNAYVVRPLMWATLKITRGEIKARFRIPFKKIMVLTTGGLNNISVTSPKY